MQETLAAVEALLKKHEAFERSMATQEERFAALERLTTVTDDRLFHSVSYDKRVCSFAAVYASKSLFKVICFFVY